MDHKEYFARVATHTLTGTYNYRDLVMLVLKLLQKLTTRQVHKVTQEKRAHYEWMLKNLELNERHRYWITTQLKKVGK